MNRKHHYSIYVTDPAAQRLLEKQESKSEFVAGLLAQYAAGELVLATDARQRKLEAEASLAEAKLAAFLPDRRLKREAIRADINLKITSSHVTSLTLQRQLARLPGTPSKHYVLPNQAGDALDMFCPICYRVCASAVHVEEASYTRAKVALVKHCVGEHGANAARFDQVFPSFNHLERMLLGKAVRATPTEGELDQLFKPGLPDPDP